MNDYGFKVVVYNCIILKVDEFLEGVVKGINIIGVYFLEDLVFKLECLCKVMLMVCVGDVVD